MGPWWRRKTSGYLHLSQRAPSSPTSEDSPWRLPTGEDKGIAFELYGQNRSFALWKRIILKRLRPLLLALLIALVLFTLALHLSGLKVPAFSLTAETSSSSSLYAYATLFAPHPDLDGKTDADPASDVYFTATRVLGYQLLHAPETKTNTSIPFVVIATEDVPQAKIDRFRKDGITVQVVPTITASWLAPGRPRWRDMMAKLHVLALTQYQRVLMLDTDMLLTRRMDGIFTDPYHSTPQPVNHSLAQPDEGPLPDTYLFAAQSYYEGRSHPYPPESTDRSTFSGGFWLVQPCEKLFNHYLKVLNIPDRFDSNAMEQNLLNYVHRRSHGRGPKGVQLSPGPMPWQDLYYLWTTCWPGWKDYEAGAASLHEKWWDKTVPQLDDRLAKKWFAVKVEMESFYAEK